MHSAGDALASPVSNQMSPLPNDHFRLHLTCLAAAGLGKRCRRHLQDLCILCHRNHLMSHIKSLYGNLLMPPTQIGKCIVNYWTLDLKLFLCSFEVPILFCPDTGFRSAEAILHPQSWLEMPLTSDRPVPLRCAVCEFLKNGIFSSNAVPFLIGYFACVGYVQSDVFYSLLRYLPDNPPIS